MARNFMLLYGKKSVYERLRANPASVRSIFLEEGTSIPRIEKLARRCHIPLERVTARRIRNMKRAKNVQGVIARVDRYAYTPFEDILAAPAGEKTSLVFLDRINDPQNLGIIVRSLACFGGFAVVIPGEGACAVTEAVLHVACGGENYLRISRVQDMEQALAAAKNQGYWIMAAMVEGGKSLHSVTMHFPLCLVLGAETEGVSPGLARYIDAKVSIPMLGEELSLNVAMTCAIFTYEADRQRVGR